MNTLNTGAITYNSSSEPISVTLNSGDYYENLSVSTPFTITNNYDDTSKTGTISVHYDNTSGVIEDRLVNTNNTFVSDVFTLSVVLSDSIAFSATFNLYVKKSNLIPISYYIILLTQRNNVIMVSIWKVQMKDGNI